MEMLTIKLVGYLSDVKTGDKLYYARSMDENEVLEVTVESVELTLYADGYHPTWINCKWEEADGEQQEDGIAVTILFKTKEEALKYLIKQEQNYINDLADQKARAQVRIMDLEEQITQLHVGDQNER